MSKCTNNTGFNFSSSNGSYLGWTSNGTPCSFKPTTSSSYGNIVTFNYNSVIERLDSLFKKNLDDSFKPDFLKFPIESKPYVRPEFVPYTPPVKSFLEEPKYIPPVSTTPTQYTTGDNYVIQELTTNLSKWQNLNYIDFSSKQLGDDSCRQLGQAFNASLLPHLFGFDLSNNQITDIGARYLSDPIYQGKMPKLVNLYITDNYLTYMGKEILINTVCQIQWKQKISVTVDHGTAMPNTETQLILNNWCLLQNKYSGIDVGYGQIHHNPIIGESYSYRRIPFMDEVAGTIKIGKDLGTLHHKLVVNAYNRELVDSDLCYLGNKITNHYDPKVIAPPTISSVTLNLCLFDLHKNNITHLGVHNFLHFFKGQNIKEVNLSNNQIGDEGAKLLADSLVKGEMPKLKVLRLEDNKITDKGVSYYLDNLKKDQLSSTYVSFTSSKSTIDKIMEFFGKGARYYVSEYEKAQQSSKEADIAVNGKDGLVIVYRL